MILLPFCLRDIDCNRDILGFVPFSKLWGSDNGMNAGIVVAHVCSLRFHKTASSQGYL